MVETYSDLIDELVVQIHLDLRISNREKPQTGHTETASHDDWS